MKRFGFDHFGSPRVFNLINAQAPQPKAGQVQLEVLGFGLNPYDASLRRGEQTARPLKFPIVPGSDVVGRVSALGEGVDDFQLGDVVINYRPIGGYSEFVTASTSKIIKKPTAISFMTAAALPLVGIAAFSILNQLDLHQHDRLVIIGAGGGVGSILVQLAKAQGVHVVAIASLAHHDQLKALGADVILDDVEAQALQSHHYPNVVNVRFNGATTPLAQRLVTSGGKLLTSAYVDVPDGDYQNLHLTKLAPTDVALAALMTTARSWGLTMTIGESLPFTVEGVRHGHELMEAGNTGGKLVVMQPDTVLNAAHLNRNLL
ncbi:NADP-dependent oxidoreductase [Lacticaseibacillus porcinae]|uniref:NADP-dependent oxidoreductase n=1 Tax=Lacticaseibacillus porcinae TaxID=1123687 RepID=UPI000F7A117F|nr:NADP-dependent oxidoreductase [Lacticaseibacillus porcinae]